MIYQNLKLKESYFFWWLPNHQTDQNYCRYDMNTLCLPQAVYECQTQKIALGSGPTPGVIADGSLQTFSFHVISVGVFETLLEKNQRPEIYNG
jgi:hypothetical protein